MKLTQDELFSIFKNEHILRMKNKRKFNWKNAIYVTLKNYKLSKGIILNWAMWGKKINNVFLSKGNYLFAKTPEKKGEKIIFKTHKSSKLFTIKIVCFVTL